MKPTLPKNQRDVTHKVNGNAPDVPAKWVRYHSLLVALRERLTGDQRGLVGQAVCGETAGMHIADVASDRCEQGLASTLLTSERNLLLEIEEALGRMRAGTYGICELSGLPVSAARLRAVPWTRFSAKAEQQLEAKLRSPVPEMASEMPSANLRPAVRLSIHDHTSTDDVSKHGRIRGGDREN